MAILHIIFFKFKDGAPINDIMSNLRTLPDVVPDVLSVTCGENFMPERAKCFTHSMVTLHSYYVHIWHYRSVRFH